MFYNIPDDTKKLCRMSQHCKSRQTCSRYIIKAFQTFFSVINAHNTKTLVREPVLKKALVTLLEIIIFTCRAEWKIHFDFVKYNVREYRMGGSTQIKLVSKILQSFV